MDIVRHKVFISYYHKEDQYYKNEFERVFKDIFINKSVGDGEIETDLSTDYIKKLIQSNYITDTSVIVVLVGENTWKRKHVDWEISAALNKKVGGYSGLVGLCLPSHNAFKKPNYEIESIPPRLADNLSSKYAKLYDWTTDESKMKDYINEAFQMRKLHSDLIDNDRIQYKINR